MKLLKRVLKWITAAILVLLLLAFLAGFIAYWRSTNDCGKAGAPTDKGIKTANSEHPPVNIITKVEVSGVLDNSSISKISKGIAEHVQRLVPSTNRFASGRRV